MKLQLYNIRCAEVCEYDKIRTFINNYWKEGHILAKSQTLFDFQHLRDNSSTYDFVIAEEKETGEIHAVYGYINSSIYDKQSENKPNAIWGALWKVRKDVKNAEIKKLGLGVLFYILDLYPESPFITLGLSKYSQFVFEGLDFEFGRMNHYYFANKKCKKPVIAVNLLYKELTQNDDVSFRLFSFKEHIKSDYLPQKNNDFLLNRYVRHPYYKYDLWGLYNKDELINVWVLRLVDLNGSRCLRLVDIVGRTKTMPIATNALQYIVEYYQAEYIDCYNHGIPEQEFLKIGMYKVEPPTIIPNYFEPYEQKNIDIFYAYSFDRDICIFKADGDQDRPSKVD